MVKAKSILIYTSADVAAAKMYCFCVGHDVWLSCVRFVVRAYFWQRELMEGNRELMKGAISAVESQFVVTAN